MPENIDMYIIISLKLAIGFLCLVIYLNLSGRAQISPNSAADQIGNYVLGGIIGGVIYNPAVSIAEMVIVIFLWGALILTMRFFKNRSRAAKQLIDGQSIQLFGNGRLLTDNLRLAGKTARDFIAGMHLQGVHRLNELESVWIETNGQYTILKKGEIPFPLSMVEDGHIVQESLNNNGKDEEWLQQELAKQGVKDISRVAYAEWYCDKESEILQVYLYD